MTDSKVDLTVSVKADVDAQEIGKPVREDVKTFSISMETAEKIEKLVREDLGRDKYNEESVLAITAPNIVHMFYPKGDTE